MEGPPKGSQAKKRLGGGEELTHPLPPPTTPSGTATEDEPTLPPAPASDALRDGVQLLPGGGDRDQAESAPLAAAANDIPLPDWYTSGDGEERSHSKEIVIGCLEGVRRGFRCLPCRSGGVNLALMVDSGATVNLLKAKRLRQLEKKFSLPSKPVDIVLKGLGGSSLRCRRATLVPLEVGSEIICTWMLETPNDWGLKSTQRFDGLLGQEFLNLPGHELILLKDGKPLNLEYTSSIEEAAEEVQICCTVTHDVELQPGEAVCTTVQPSNRRALPRDTYLEVTTASTASNYECSTQRVIFDPSEADTLPITLYNQGDQCLSLERGDAVYLVAQKIPQREVLLTEEDVGTISDLPQQKVVAEAAEADDDELEKYLKYDPSVVDETPVVYNEQRANLVLNRLKPATWELENPEQIQRVKDLIKRKQQAFHLPTEPLTTTHVLKHHIETGDAAPVRMPARFIPYKIREAVESETKGLIRNGQAILTDSPWNCNIVMVKRKHGEHYRMCTDSRSLNAVTSPVYFPIPRIEDILARAAQCSWFSSLDLRSAYSQVPLTEESIPKTAFSTHNGKYAYKVMPFGLIGAPATFQRLMHIVFSDLFNDGVSAFLDNIDLFHLDFETHLAILEKVLDRLIEANLKLSPEKTFLFRKAIKSLGHQVSYNSIKPDQDKIEAIKNFPAPTNKKGVRQFLGLSGYYRRFIAGYAKMAAPLHDLTKLETSFKWGDQEEAAFQELKKALSEHPVLTAPDFDKPYVIFCDASDIAIGGVLTQLDSDSKKYMPIAYMSRVLKGSEKHYLIYEKEALAVVEAATKFKPYIWGQQCEIFTDNSAITYLFGKSCEKNARAARWALNLQAQNLKVSHLPGKCNVVADCLSRPTAAMIDCVPDLGGARFTLYHRGKKRAEVGAKLIGTVCQADAEDLVEPLWNPDTVKKLQEEDPLYGEVINYLMNPKKTIPEATRKRVPDIAEYYLDAGLLYKSVGDRDDKHDVIVVPKKLLHQALKLSHEHVSAGHPGPKRSVERARKYFFWPRMISDVKSFVGKCDVCQRVKTGGNPLMPLKTYPMPTTSWETVSVDLVGPFPLTERGNKWLLVMVDHLSRFCALAALQNKTADEVADSIVKICAFLDFPKIVLSDHGTEFKNATMAALAKYHGFDNHYTAVYHPASNGLFERKNRDVVTTIRATIEILHEEWDRCLPAVQLALNTSYHRAIGDSPYFVMFGKDKLRPKLTFKLPRSYDPDLRFALTQIIYDKVSEELKKSQEEYRRYRENKVTKNKEPLTVGARVFIKNLKRKSKLDPLWIGPMRINKNVGAAQYELIDLRTGRKFHRHGEHIVARRQADINRWQFPECDEPFPREVRDDDIDLSRDLSRPDEDPEENSDSDEEFGDDDPDDDLVGDEGPAEGGETTELEEPEPEINRAGRPGILKTPGNPEGPRTRPKSRLAVNFDNQPTVNATSQPGTSRQLVEPDTPRTPTNVNEDDGRSNSLEPISTSDPTMTPTSPRRKWMGEVLEYGRRKLRNLSRINYKAMHEGK